MMRTSIAFVMFSCLTPMLAQADPVELGRHLLASDQGTREPGVQPGLPGTFFWGFPQFGADLFGVVLTPDDVGRTFRVTAETDPKFALAAALLTDGVDDPVQYSLRFADGEWAGEDDFEGASPTFLVHPGPGDIVSAITFRLDGFSLRDGPSFREFQYLGVIGIEGTPAVAPPPGPTDPAPIPEPATLILVGTGVAAGLIRARRRGGPSRRVLPSEW